MAGSITLLGIAVIITDMSVFLLMCRMNRQEDTMVIAFMVGMAAVAAWR